MQLFVGYVKDSVLPLPQELPELQRQIIATISEMDCDMLQQEWAEMDYWLDVIYIYIYIYMCVCVCVYTHTHTYIKKLGEGLFPSVVRIFQSFPPFKCTDFINCVREL